MPTALSSVVRLSSSILAGLRTPILVLALTAIAYGCFVYSRLSNRNWDWSYFVTAGNEFVNPEAVRTSLYIWPNAGYDGQFYYRLALNPLSSDREAYGIILDNPAYRQQRILYPALAWAVTLGHVRFVPAALVLINLVALCALAWFAASLAQSSGRSPLWGLALALYPGFLLALSRDLTEILAAALLLGALWCLRRNWASAAAIALTLAVLARETAGFVVAMIALTYALDRWRRRTPSFPAYVFVLPGAVAAAWQVFLYYRWQAVPLLSGQDKIRLPLAALWQFLSTHVGRALARHWPPVCRH